MYDVKPISAKVGRGSWNKQSDEICVLSFDMQLTYYLYNVNLHEFPKFEYLHVT
jgi:hypothetical protein